MAIWGMETGFGHVRGTQHALSAVATLAYDSRRSAYFTDQLYAALTLIDRGALSPSARGSMHGEIGHAQFLPKNILQYGVGNLDVAPTRLPRRQIFSAPAAGARVPATSLASPISPPCRPGTSRRSTSGRWPSWASRSTDKNCWLHALVNPAAPCRLLPTPCRQFETSPRTGIFGNLRRQTVGHGTREASCEVRPFSGEHQADKRGASWLGLTGVLPAFCSCSWVALWSTSCLDRPAQ
jgi:Transglycosylase SLT domain